MHTASAPCVLIMSERPHQARCSVQSFIDLPTAGVLGGRRGQGHLAEGRRPSTRPTQEQARPPPPTPTGISAMSQTPHWAHRGYARAGRWDVCTLPLGPGTTVAPPPTHGHGPSRAHLSQVSQDWSFPRQEFLFPGSHPPGTPEAGAALATVLSS